MPRSSVPPDLRIVSRSSIPVALHCPKHWPPVRTWLKLIGKKRSSSRGSRSMIPPLRHAPLTNYWTWARTPPSSVLAIAVLLAFENMIGGQFTHGRLHYAPNLPSDAAMRLLRD